MVDGWNQPHSIQICFGGPGFSKSFSCSAVQWEERRLHNGIPIDQTGTFFSFHFFCNLLKGTE
jgi:hypothetical protein